MRNDSNNWGVPDVSGGAVVGSDVTVARTDVTRQTIVSGTDVLDRFTPTLGPAVGWPKVAQGASYAIALRRDRVLVVGGPSLEDGWDAATGHAISDMTGGYAVFELSGAAVLDLLKSRLRTH